jgi:hemoglobin
MMTLFAQLGGEAAIQAAVVLFYEKVMADASLAPFFDGIDFQKQIEKQIAFMTMAFDGPNDYSGRDLRTAHAGLVKRGLSDAHFDKVAAHLAETLDELGISADVKTQVLSIVDGTRADVLAG